MEETLTSNDKVEAINGDGEMHMTFPIYIHGELSTWLMMWHIVLELNYDYDWSSTSLIHCQLSQFTIHVELCCL